MMMTTNLPSGYHRDLQLLKEHLFPAFSTLKNSIEMAGLMISNIEVKENILADEKYKYLFTVDAVNELVMQGTPFRDAYKIIGQQVEENSFERPVSDHTGKGHEGSINNLCNTEINEQMQKLIKNFPFTHVHQAIEKLVGSQSA